MFVYLDGNNDKLTPQAKALWEKKMGEPWEIYDKASRYVQIAPQGITGGFAVYYDNSDGVAGNFISGWSARKNLRSVMYVLQQFADDFGEIYVKTDKRQMKIICEKIGKLVKNAGSFAYYIIRSNNDGETKGS